jgi:threonine synthase
MCYTLDVKQSTDSFLVDLECAACGKRFDAGRVQTICSDCLSLLFARYDLDALGRNLSPAKVSRRQGGLWRWSELLPVHDPALQVTLGEADTPLLPVPRLGDRIGLEHLRIKDEGLNPTGSCQARGMAATVSRGVELGIRDMAIVTGGNSGSALAAYACVAGVQAHLFMTPNALPVYQREARFSGADIDVLEGPLEEVISAAVLRTAEQGWFDVSIFNEPYRLEGMKTLGFELARDFEWSLPDVIICPAGKGGALLGMSKAFQELRALGWIEVKSPRLVGVQLEGRDFLVQAYHARVHHDQKQTGASHEGQAKGLAPGSELALEAVQESGGAFITAPESETLEIQRRAAHTEGILLSFDGATGLYALQQLLALDWLRADESVVVINPASGLKYIQ